MFGAKVYPAPFLYAKVRNKSLTAKYLQDFSEAHLATLQSRLGILEKGCPTEPTLCRLEKGIDPDAMASMHAARRSRTGDARTS